jgi:periplasmic divalent cation tolerance protein
MVIKTRSNLVEKLIMMVEDIHSYEIPCILEISVNSGSDNYLKWIDSELI